MKFLFKIFIGAILILVAYLCFAYFVTYSEGVRSGDLVKFSKKGVIFKTWEGKLSQGVSEELQFDFSVEKGDQTVINELQNLQGTFVKLTYIERYQTFFWLGDTKYYVKKVEKVHKSE
ncbi:6-phosphogluconate dehydrogenase [Winogradskyella schleiferi]|uniref:6-phosphogluconate dehydrogenase n=1 Tax=Winogradskyella schleiferi TaxID=2686078 RepID=UPI0015BEC41F|nr:6-phosphogluconate dehydrogenase [Winogradskyella schleiferi]